MWQKQINESIDDDDMLRAIDASAQISYSDDISKPLITAGDVIEFMRIAIESAGGFGADGSEIQNSR